LLHMRFRTYLAILAVLALGLAACNGDDNGDTGDNGDNGEQAGTGEVVLAEEVETDELYGIGIQQDNEALKQAIDDQLADIIADGTYEGIYSDWFEGEVPERFQGGDGEATSGDTDYGDLGLIDEGTLRVGSDIDFAPFEFIEAGEPRGFDVDLMNEIGDRLDLEVEFVNTGFDGIFSQLAIGEFDAIISAITITEERRETIEFSEPYFAANQGLATLDGSDINGVGDLTAETRVAVQAATTGAEYAQANFDVTIVEFPTSPAAFAALESGQVDAVFIDLPVIGARIAGTLEDEADAPVADDEAVDDDALEEGEDDAATDTDADADADAEGDADSDMDDTDDTDA
jgi:ABC-type amino acid transport substrate-binding protein